MTQSQRTLTQQEPKRLAHVALQAFFHLAEHWQLSAHEARILLGSPPKSTFYQWQAKQSTARLSRDTLERISYLLGIYQALHRLLPSQKAADDWLRKPNAATLFNGQSAMERMLAGNLVDLADVRRYLDAQLQA